MSQEQDYLLLELEVASLDGRMQSVLRTTSRPETNIKTFFCMYVEASVLVSPPPRSRDENDDQDLMVLMACSGELFYRKTDIKP